VRASKRNQLILLAFATAAAIALTYFFLILPLQGKLKHKQLELATAEERLRWNRRTLEMSESLKEDLSEASAKLQTLEEGVARGDVYRWTLNSLLGFSDQFHLDFNNIDQPVIGDPVYPPKLPYKSGVFTVSGTGTYFDFCDFLVEFEKRFPLIYCQSLELDPAPFAEADPEVSGKLSFKVGLSVLIKPRSGTP